MSAHVIVVNSSDDSQQSRDVQPKVVNRQQNKQSIIPSKVLVIENVSVTIQQGLDEDISFELSNVPAVLCDRLTVPEIDIGANEDILFDETISLAKLEHAIRRSGVLERYSMYLSNDPEIVINSYTLSVRKDYKFFEEFKEGVLIAEDIFM